MTANGWFAARPSGTEDIYKIYAESFRSEDHLRQVQDDAKALIGRAFAQRQGRTGRGGYASSEWNTARCKE